MLTIFRWNATDRAGHWLTADQLPQAGGQPAASADIWWIDLESPTEEEEQQVFARFLPVHPLTLEDITKLRREPEVLPHFPKVEEFPDYLFVVVNPLTRVPSDSAADHPATSQLSAILTHTVLITHHFQPLSSVEHLRGYLAKHAGQVERGPDFLFHVILDESVDEYAPMLDRVTDRLDMVEDEVFGQASPQLLAHLLELKRDIVVLRKTLILEREVLARLIRGEFSLIDAREVVYYRNVYDHVVRYAELIETAREMVSDLMQTHLAATSNKLNGIMKALTMISTIILPMSLIAGVYGMNFDYIPVAKQGNGFFVILAAMALAGAGVFGFIRWRRWY